MGFQIGDWVERRHPRSGHRIGRVHGVIKEDSHYYVCGDVGATYCEVQRNLLPSRSS
jgi:hypothetical protein